MGYRQFGQSGQASSLWGGMLQMKIRYAVVVDDLALLSNDWHFVGAGMEFSSRTSEVTRRQSDGTWKYMIDNPYAGE
jgi:hypothetical protein